MNIAFNGCFHGEIEKVYDTMKHIEEENDIKIDALVCCGDFQAVRNMTDLNNLSCPKKYLQMGVFHEYYSGKKKAPYLTIFVGGNHEASNYMRELYFGGWVCPNMYYLGGSGSIILKKDNLRYKLAGMSGIYKPNDFFHQHLEKYPLDMKSKVSVYHTKQIDVFKLSMLKKEDCDIFLSHDWPNKVTQHGNFQNLFRLKPHFRIEAQNDQLGNPAHQYLMDILKPSYWFSGHLHVKFSAIVRHIDGKKTKFLALDKCLPRRQFLQICNFPVNQIDLLQKDQGKQQQQSENQEMIDEQNQPEQLQQLDPEKMNKKKSTEISSSEQKQSEQQGQQESPKKQEQQQDDEADKQEGWGSEEQEQENQQQEQQEQSEQQIEEEKPKDTEQEQDQEQQQNQNQQTNYHQQQQLDPEQQKKQYQERFSVQDKTEELFLEYDPLWLAILKATTSEYIKFGNLLNFYDYSHQRCELFPKDECVNKEKLLKMLVDQYHKEFEGKNMRIPDNFEITAAPYDPKANETGLNPDKVEINNQTKYLLALLGLEEEQFKDFLFYDNIKEKASELNQEMKQEGTENQEEIPLNLDDNQELEQQQQQQQYQQQEEQAGNQEEMVPEEEQDVQQQVNQLLDEQNEDNQQQDNEEKLNVNKEELPFL